MKKSTFTLCAAFMTLSVAACSTWPTSLPPGEYEKTQKSTNSAGTDTETKTTTKVYYDESGNKRATKETETTRDPKGMFNKTTTTKTENYN